MTGYQQQANGLILPEPQKTEYKPSFDLNICHAQFERQGIVIWMTWNQMDGQACMVLTPAHKRISPESVVPCVVMQRNAFRWAEETCDPVEVLFLTAMFCANLGLNPSEMRDQIKVLSIIRDYMGDLLSIPPMPRGHFEVVADAFILDNATGKEVHKEVKDHA